MGSDTERRREARSGEDDADTDASAKPLKKKKKKKKKKARRKKKAANKKAANEKTANEKAAKKKRPEAEAAKDEAAQDEPEGDGAKKDDGEGDEAPKRRIPWLAIILVIAAVELFLFGNRGRIEVCVAKEGVHDFGLVGTPRTEDNTASYPSCETRLNIGMKSRYDDLKTDAVVQACRRANMFRGKEAILTCAVEADGWTHRITTDFVKPWEPEYRKKLFWFLE